MTPVTHAVLLLLTLLLVSTLAILKCVTVDRCLENTFQFTKDIIYQLRIVLMERPMVK